MENISQVLGVRGGLTKKAYKDLLGFKSEVAQQFGNRFKLLILFGSRARLEARANSDIDVAVILDKSAAGFDADLLLSKLAFPYLVKGTPISALSMPDNLKKQAECNYLAHSILHEGFEVG